jgi:hypothetical protein
MAKQQDAARKQSSKRNEKRETDRDTAANGRDGDVASYEQELAGYLQSRIKPGLNRGSIPLLARSIAKEIARHEYSNGSSRDAEEDEELIPEDEDEPTAEEDEDEPSAEEDDEEPTAEEDDDEPRAEEDEDAGDEGETDLDLEAALHELQAELGEDWILYFSVQGDDTWLTAEKDDATQRVEAPNAKVLTRAVKVLNDGGGRRRAEAR